MAGRTSGSGTGRGSYYDETHYPRGNGRPYEGGGGRNSRSSSGRKTSGSPSRKGSAGGRSGRSAQGSSRRSGSGGGRYPSGGRQAASGNRRRRRKQSRRFVLFFLLILLLIAVCIGGMLFFGKADRSFPSLTSLSESLGSIVKSEPDRPQISVSLDTLDSPYAVMLDCDSGEVIGSKRADEKIFPASMAKIMTVLTAIEHIDDLDRTVTMSYDYYETLYAQDASRAGFEPGEEAVIRDLLYGALLPSGAECCMELSIQAAGSEAAFADLMNQKAQELGLTQTHFTNSTGLHHEEQYSTPYEIAKILQSALANKTFRDVFTTHYYSVAPTSVHPDGFTFWSTMFKNMQAETVIGGEILGGKTGYTGEAGYCLASMAEIEGREYIQVTAGWAANPRTSLYHINDAFIGYNIVGRVIAEAREE